MHVCLVSTCGTPKPAVVFHSVEKSLTVSLCQTLCMDSVLKKTEKHNLWGCKCTTLPPRWAPLHFGPSVVGRHITQGMLGVRGDIIVNEPVRFCLHVTAFRLAMYAYLCLH